MPGHDEAMKAIQADAHKRMAQSVDVVKKDMASVRTGRANPDLLSSVMVNYYGTITPLNQLAQVNAPESQLIVVTVFDRSQAKEVEKAIQAAGLGLNQGSNTVERSRWNWQGRPRGTFVLRGLDVEVEEQVQPVKRQGRLDADDLVESGCPFAIGEHVDLGRVVDVGSPPEVEDREFHTATSLGQLSDGDFWQVLERTAANSLEEIFGSELVPDAPGRTIAPGVGRASLGHLRPESTPRLYISQDGRLRMMLSDAGDAMNLSVTDLRLYEDDLMTPDQDAVNEVSRAIRRGTGVILAVGVGRPYPPDSPRHWLQVNSIHLESDPLGTR